MVNNQEQFNAYHDLINVTSTRRTTLKNNRKALRNKIKNYFKNNHEGEIQPSFYWQGSYAMHTILNPIKDEDKLGAYDLDDGVYFVGTSEDDRKDIEWYHKEVLNAVNDHTDQGAEDNDPCITVNYADGHHVDLPIYFKIDGERPQLAHRATPWIGSDPKELKEWFSDQCKDKPKLRRMVRYLKGWADNINNSKGFKMPTGCILTMLADKYYAANSDNREDIMMRDMLTNMYNALSEDDGFTCERPTYPYDDLFEGYNETRKKKFLAELKAFKEDAERAINETNPRRACLKWQKHFGDRFSCSTAKDEDEDAKKNEKSGFLKNNSRFA